MDGSAVRWSRGKRRCRVRKVRVQRGRDSGRISGSGESASAVVATACLVFGPPVLAPDTTCTPPALSSLHVRFACRSVSGETRRVSPERAQKNVREVRECGSLFLFLSSVFACSCRRHVFSTSSVLLLCPSCECHFVSLRLFTRTSASKSLPCGHVGVEGGAGGKCGKGSGSAGTRSEEEQVSRKASELRVHGHQKRRTNVPLEIG